MLADSGCQVFNAHFDEDFGRSTPDDSVRIVRRDLAWLAKCDAAIVYLPSAAGTPLPTPGTYVELGALAVWRKPTLILWDEACAAQYNHMVRGLTGLHNFRFLDAGLIWSAPRNILDSVVAALASKEESVVV